MERVVRHKQAGRALWFAALLLLFLISGMLKAKGEGQGTALSFGFDVQNKWDQKAEGFILPVTTDTTPEEGILLTADILVPSVSGSAPQFRGRIHVIPALVTGEDRAWVKSNTPAQVRAVNFTEAVTREGVLYYRTRVEIPFSGMVGTNQNGAWAPYVPFSQAVTGNVVGAEVYLAGCQCDYSGLILLENVGLSSRSSGTGDGISVLSTVQREDQTSISVAGDSFVTESGNGPLSDGAWLSSDPAADAKTQGIYGYLKAVGRTGHVIFGHENDAWSKSGMPQTPLNGLTSSDVEDMTGSLAGIMGLDTLSLTGRDYSATTYNHTLALQGKAPYLDIASMGEVAANVAALANLTNYCIGRGVIVTLSSHMPNFAFVTENSAYQEGRDAAYARFDFNTSTERTMGGDTMNQILPGGSLNDRFTAYLDMIADYARQVNGPVLFRPFHEGTGGWFWWGRDCCSAETYREVYRYTVRYLQDEKQIHNFIYIYSPDGEPGFEERCEERYPGDEYVDLMGLDLYQIDPQEGSGWFEEAAGKCARMAGLAAGHGKPWALTETGMNTTVPDAGDVVTGMHRTGNPDRQWFQRMLEITSQYGACYFLTWRNNDEAFYTPYVRAANPDGSLYGHEMLDDFISFYNDRRSIFAVNQEAVLSALP